MDSRTYHLTAEPHGLAAAKFHLGASLIRVHVPADRDGTRVVGAQRGEIEGFSQQSRKRLMLLLNTISRDADLPLFVTLTYPREWSDDPLEWKRHLKNFSQWMRREHPGAAFVWKLEPQKRGAPHFHLMVYGASFLAWQTIAIRWAEVVADVHLPSPPPAWSRGREGAEEFSAYLATLDFDQASLIPHLRAGTEVKLVRSRNGIKAYASKNYMGKDVEGFSGVGRFWGVHNRRALPRPKAHAVTVPRVVMVAFARSVRKAAERRGFRARHTKSIDLFTESPEQWHRLLTEYIAGRCGTGGAVLTEEDVQRKLKCGREAKRHFSLLTRPVIEPSSYWRHS